MVKILNLKFRQDLKLEFGQFFCRGYVESKLNLGRDSETRFGQDFEVKALRRGSCLVEILNMKFDQDMCLNL